MSTKYREKPRQPDNKNLLKQNQRLGLHVLCHVTNINKVATDVVRHDIATTIISLVTDKLLHTLGRINHYAGCTMGKGPRQGAPTNCQFFTTLFWRLNVEQTFGVGLDVTQLKGRQFWGEKVHPEKNPGSA